MTIGVLEFFNHTTHLSNEPGNYSSDALVVCFNQVVFAVIFFCGKYPWSGSIKNLM